MTTEADHSQSRVVRERQAMLAGMRPVLKDGLFVFCIAEQRDIAEQARAFALGWFEEDEGTTLILKLPDAEHFGFDVRFPVARIVLEVFSALDGVGLTAGVSSALADEGIPCNMVAAYHHDNVFIPASMAQQAMAVLLEVQARAAS